jgi:peptide/nickel transport system substrate-binding protein
LLTGAAGAAAAAAVAGTVGLARRSSGSQGPAATPSPVGLQVITPTTPPSATPTPVPQGGVARLVSSRGFNFDTFDAARSGELSALEVLGRTHSRLVRWTAGAQTALEPDLAAAWEQPDETTISFRLAPNARWQDRPPLAGRLVSADDVVKHFQRVVELARGGLPAPQRGHEYSTIRRISSPDGGRVLFELARPDPFLVYTLAGQFALVQAPGVVEQFGAKLGERRPEHVVGSGPFLYDGPVNGGALSFTAHRGGHRRPNLDGLTVSPPGATAEAFARGESDTYLARDRRDAPLLRARGGFSEAAWFEDSPVVTTVFAGAAPWDNLDLRLAVSAALNRQELAARLFGGRAVPAGPIPPVSPAFALSETEIAGYPGYGRLEADRREARARWEAGGGPALGGVTVDIPSIFDPLYTASAIVPAMLHEALGAAVRPAVDSYTAISARAVAHRYGNGEARLWFGWGPPLFDPEPSRLLIANFRSGGPGFATTGYRSEALDRVLDQLAVEFSLERRQALAREASRLILQAGGGGLWSWLQQRSEFFWRRGFSPAFTVAPWYGFDDGASAFISAM